MKYLLTLFVIGSSISGFSQIVTKTNIPKDSISKTKDPNGPKSTTSYYLGTGRNNSFRLLKENDEPYGKPLGNRANETHLKIWSYELGIREQLNNYLQLDGGIALERFGEQYSATGATELGDSTFSYKSMYSFISVPIQLYGTVGDDFKLYGGAGISPGIVSSFNQEVTRIDSLGSTNTVTTNKPERLNSFLFSTRLSAGLQWKWNKNLGIYMNYTYFVGLTSTYNKQDPYKHYARYGCLRFGLMFQI